MSTADHSDAGSTPEGPAAETATSTSSFGRRRFLVGAGLGLGAVAATAWIRPTRLLDHLGATATSPVTTPSTDTIIVNVFLRGAADGLSLLPPLGDATLQQLRPGVAVPDDVALPLDGRFGLHPAFTNVKRLFDEGRAAFVPAAGSPSSIRSHFSAQARMDRAVVDGPLPTTGWLGRYLTSTADGDDALRSIGIGVSLQPSLLGSSTIAMPNLQSMTLTTPGSTSTTLVHDAVAAMYEGTSHDSLRSASRAALDAIDELAPITASATPPESWPTGFGATLWPIAHLIASGFPVEVATADLGGWDVHHDMGAATDPDGGQHRLIASLDAALGAFFTHIGDAAARTVVVITTEFGRRIALNGSNGTDHGRGMVMMVLGGGVRPGIHGDWPGLVDTDAGDVRVVNDYRRVYAEVLDRRGRSGDLEIVFPDFDPSDHLGVLVA